MQNHGNTVSHTQTYKTIIQKLKVMEYCNLTNKKFKIAIMKKLKELQENSKRQFNELRNKIN